MEPATGGFVARVAWLYTDVRDAAMITRVWHLLLPPHLMGGRVAVKRQQEGRKEGRKGGVC